MTNRFGKLGSLLLILLAAIALAACNASTNGNTNDNSTDGSTVDDSSTEGYPSSDSGNNGVPLSETPTGDTNDNSTGANDHSSGNTNDNSGGNTNDNSTGDSTDNSESSGPNVESIALERQACFGACPVYTLTIRADGQVDYEGLDNVETTGTQTASIDPEAVQALSENLVGSGFLDFQDSYMNQDVSDLAYVITTVNFTDGSTKRIEHYYGDSSAPEILTELETQIDEAANVSQWVGEQTQSQ